MKSTTADTQCGRYFSAPDKSPSRALYFYRGGAIVAVVQGDSYASVIRGESFPLAITRRADPHDSVELLAVDYQATRLHGAEHTNESSLNFSPYGYLAVTSQMLVGFKGERRDAVTGLDLLGMGYRSFSPVLMRFTSCDSESPFGAGGINCYAAMFGDPINGIDPTGRSPLFGSRQRYQTRIIDNDLRVFFSIDDPVKGGRTLNISSHGQAGRMVVGGEKYTGEQMYHLLTANGYKPKKQPIRVIACHSADVAPGGDTSFIQQLSNKAGQTVEGFEGKVNVHREQVPAGSDEHAEFKLEFEIHSTRNVSVTVTPNRKRTTGLWSRLSDIRKGS